MNMNNLAHLLQYQRRYPESYLLYQRACPGLRNILGDRHPITVNCVQNYESLLKATKQAGN